MTENENKHECNFIKTSNSINNGYPVAHFNCTICGATKEKIVPCKEHNYIKENTFINKLGFTVARYKCQNCNGIIDAKARPKG